MKYKSKNLDFLSNDMKMSNLCFCNDYYYFECDSEIPEAEIISDEEFEEAVASVVVAEPPEPEATPDPIMEKLNSIEEKIRTNEELQTFYDDIVKEVGL